MEDYNNNWVNYSNKINNNKNDDFRNINYNKDWIYFENKVQFKEIDLW